MPSRSKLLDRACGYSSVNSGTVPAPASSPPYPPTARTRARTRRRRGCVDRVIEDLHAQVRHADLIRVREQEGVAHVHLLWILHDRAELAAHVAHGLGDLHHQRVDFIRKRQGFFPPNHVFLPGRTPGREDTVYIVYSITLPPGSQPLSGKFVPAGKEAFT